MRKRIRANNQPLGMFAQIIDMFAKFDSDLDKIPDYRDCNPFNPKKHGIKPSRIMRRRLENLPIYVTTKENIVMGIYPKDEYHILSKEAKKNYPYATKTALGTIKKYPSIIGKMEKTGPDKFTFLMKSGKDFGITILDKKTSEVDPGIIKRREVIVYTPEEKNISKQEYISGAKIMTKLNFPEEEFEHHEKTILEQAERMPFKEESVGEREAKRRKSLFMAAIHELEHVKQDIAGDLDIRLAREEILPYHKRPSELEAKESAREELRRRFEKGEITPEMYNKILELE